MKAIRLAGCRSGSLLGYLKALGVLRLVASQADSGARGLWDGPVFALVTMLSSDAMEAFLLDVYLPTPVINPWNSGAGFDGKADTAGQTMTRVLQTQGDRWKPYRDAIGFVNRRFIDTDERKRYLDSGDKLAFIRALRASCPESMLAWLDAAVVLSGDDLAFPYLLGSGGNDGRLDFSVNFAARALDVCGDESFAHARELLRDSVNDTAEARLLQDVAIGQFSPRHAGGANATSGFNADSLVNPWDYVLMIEGALLFTGSVGRRTDRSPRRPTFPFALRAIAGGYGSASDEERPRGEVWLPVWDGHASLASLRDLLRKGRVDLSSDGERSVIRSAVTASEAATAVVTLGVPLGIRRFERVAFVQRNGLAYSAAAIGAISTAERFDHAIAVISRRVIGWVDRLRGIERLGAGAREALRRFDDGLLDFPSVPTQGKARARQELLVAIADIDRAIWRTQLEVDPVPRLSPEITEVLDDGTVAHRCALAVASLGAARLETDTRDELREAGEDATRTLRALLERRIREDAKERFAGWLRSRCSVSADDATEFLAFDPEERARFSRLLRAYSLVRLTAPQVERPKPWEGEAIDAAYAVLKLVFDNPSARDDRIVRLLFSGNPSVALTMAVRRARAIRGLPYAVRNVSDVQLRDARWTAAALALPIELSVNGYRGILNSALVARLQRSDASSVRSYLDDINPLKERNYFPVSDILNRALEAPRILIEVNLEPVQGSRFQPTGFPSLGAAEFRLPDGSANILIESAQSMANRLEGMAWDDASGELVAALRGLPYVATSVDGKETDSIREAHRLNSPYLYPGVGEQLQERVGVAGRKKKGAGDEAESSGVDIRKLARAVFYLDPNSVLHGVFLEKLVGTARLTRVLSAFIEARNTNPAESGGVKNDRVDPTGARFGGAAKGFGNVPFSRTEYTAGEITAYFSIDTALLRAYGLGREAEELLVAMALWKIRRFLQVGGRLRTACDLEPKRDMAVLKTTRPKDWQIPNIAELESIMKQSIEHCKASGLFADPPKTKVEFTGR